MIVLIVQCERCKEETECTYYRSTSHVEGGKSQSSEWLCSYCVPLRQEELDEAIKKMKSFLRSY